jgi:hypothetical protein
MMIFTIIGVIIVVILIGSFLLGMAGIPIFQDSHPKGKTQSDNTSTQSESERLLSLIYPKVQETLANYTVDKNELMRTKDMSTLHDVVTSMYYCIGIKVMGKLLEEGNVEGYLTLRESLSIHKEHHAQEIYLRYANTNARAYILDEGDDDYDNQYVTSDSIKFALDYEEYEAERVLRRYSDKTIPLGDAHSIYSEY